MYYITYNVYNVLHQIPFQIIYTVNSDRPKIYSLLFNFKNIYTTAILCSLRLHVKIQKQ